MCTAPGRGRPADARFIRTTRGISLGIALGLATLANPFGARVLHGQQAGQADPQCTSADSGGDACQKALDLFRFLNPQIGTLIAGGNATLGQGGVLGGLGHFAITVRANGTNQLLIPDLDDMEFVEGAPVQSNFTTSDSPGGFPVADVAIGLYPGFMMGGTRVGGVDALVNVFYLPEGLTDLGDDSDVSLDGTETGVKLGFGARVGLIEEGPVWPGVSVTYLRRSLPTVNVSLTDIDDDGGMAGATADTLALRDFSVQTNAWRLVAGKSFLRVFTLAAGIGRDNYDTGGRLSYAVRSEHDVRLAGNFDFGQTVTRTNLFADLSINLFIFRLVGEIGRVSGGEVATFNRFDADPSDPMVYGAVGLRFGR